MRTDNKCVMVLFDGKCHDKDCGQWQGIPIAGMLTHAYPLDTILEDGTPTCLYCGEPLVWTGECNIRA